MLQSYKELIVWQKSVLLVKEVYSIIAQMPPIEQYNLSDQMRRSAISIPSNIAEGYKRKGNNEYRRFLNIAEGSAAELETQLILVAELYNHVSVGEAIAILTEVQKMLYAVIVKLNPNSYTLSPGDTINA